MFSHPLINRNDELGPKPSRRRSTPAHTPVQVSPSPSATADRVPEPTHDEIAELYAVAIADIESNMVSIDGDRYFGAGKVFGPMVYTRDIAYSGLLGLNRLYPEMMDASLRYTRRVRRDVGWKVPRAVDLQPLGIACDVLDCTEGEFMRRYCTNSFPRRTDDVVWIWAAHDLYQTHSEFADWEWLLNTGAYFFDAFYDRLFDSEIGLYRGQASFIDIHYGSGSLSSGYPSEWSMLDCLRIFASSTNALYVKAMKCLGDAADRVGRPETAASWISKADHLAAKLRELFILDDGRVTYFLNEDGTPEPRTEALGACLFVLLGIFEAPTLAETALNALVWNKHGLSLIQPPWENDHFYHNHSSWPFVEAFYYRAAAFLGDDNALDCGIRQLATSCTPEGNFFEVTDVRTGQRTGSTRQLWTASAYAGLCLERYGKAPT
ncbi:MAG: hypothetical protein AAGJ38_10705 [Planctomycetota bacterium]